jgi:hypothetical protein
MVEAMMTITIISLASLAFFGMLIGGIKGWCAGTGQDVATSSVTMAVQKLASEIHDGKDATIVSNQLQVMYPKKVTNASTGDVIYDLSTTDPVFRRYKLENGSLIREEVNGTTILTKTVIAKHIYQHDPPTLGGTAPPAFSALNGEVNVKLKGEEQAGTKISKQQIDVRITLRNFRIL